MKCDTGASAEGVHGGFVQCIVSVVVVFLTHTIGTRKGKRKKDNNDAETLLLNTFVLCRIEFMRSVRRNVTASNQRIIRRES